MLLCALIIPWKKEQGIKKNFPDSSGFPTTYFFSQKTENLVFSLDIVDFKLDSMI